MIEGADRGDVVRLLNSAQSGFTFTDSHPDPGKHRRNQPACGESGTEQTTHQPLDQTDGRWFLMASAGAFQSLPDAFLKPGRQFRTWMRFA